MLDSMRRGASSWIIKILLGLLIVSFAVWGIGDIFVGGAINPTVASVGDEKITTSQLLENYQRDVNDLSQRAGRPLTLEQGRELGLFEQSLRQMLSRATLSGIAGDLHLTISDPLVVGTIRSSPGFQGPTGSFDRIQFENALRSTGVNEKGYIELVRREMARDQLIDSITAGVAAPDWMAEQLFRYRLEGRIAELIPVTAASMPDPGAPTDEALAAYHRANAGRYTAPEYRAVTFLHLSPEDIVAKLAVSEADLKAYYDAHRGSYFVPARKELEQLLYADEAAAKAGREKVAAGASVADVATETNAINTGATSLGAINPGDLPPLVALAVQPLKEGDLSDPVRSDFGWHVVRVAKATPEQTRSFEEVRPELERMLKMERASDSLFELSNKLQDELAGGATLEETGAKLNLPVKSIAALDRDGRNPNGLAIAELNELGDALIPIFSAREKEVSDPVETSAQAYVVFRIDSITPAALRPLETVRDQVVADWRIAERNKAAEKRAAELVTRLSEARTMEAVAREVGSVVRTTPAITRAAPLGDPLLSPQLIANLFEAKVGDYLIAPAADGNGWVVARLKEVVEPKAEGDSRMVGLRRNLEAAIASDVLAQFETAARRELNVTVNRSVVDSIDLLTGSVGRQPQRGGIGGLLGL